MSISRRQFTQTAGLAIVGAGCAVSASKAFSQSVKGGGLLSAQTISDPLLYLSKEVFEPFIGTVFKSVQAETGAAMRLVEVIDLTNVKGQHSKATGECFTLIFRQIGRDAIKTDIHRFEHSSLGDFAIMISPVGRSGKTYQAVINHLSL